MPKPRVAEREPLAEVAYRSIKAQIVTCELKPGSRVVAQDLADELGMSVTPVHHAFNRLCAEDLAYVVMRTGYIISPVTLDDVQEIFGLRLALEPMATDLGVRRASDRDLAVFRNTVRAPPQQRRASSRGSLTDAERAFLNGEYHDRFHLAVAALSGQRRLVAMIRDLLNQGRRLTHISGFAPSLSRSQGLDHGHPTPHQVITAAVLARDPEGAAEAMAQHVRGVHGRVIEMLASLPVHQAAQAGLRARHR